jgi:hypothetical protein
MEAAATAPDRVYGCPADADPRRQRQPRPTSSMAAQQTPNDDGSGNHARPHLWLRSHALGTLSIRLGDNEEEKETLTVVVGGPKQDTRPVGEAADNRVKIDQLEWRVSNILSPCVFFLNFIVD